MNGYRFRGTQGVYKPRSQADLGTGSHSSIQRLVACLNQPVQMPDERMDFVQGRSIEGCLATGSPAFLYAPARAQAIRARQRARNATPCPPPHTIGGGGHPEIFPPFSLEVNPSLFLTLLDNTHKEQLRWHMK
jgi:hypothetical protein